MDASEPIVKELLTILMEFTAFNSVTTVDSDTDLFRSIHNKA